MTVGDRNYTVEINQDNRICVDDQEVDLDFRCIDSALYSLLLNNRSYEAFVEDRDGAFQVLLYGRPYTVNVEDEQSLLLKRRSKGFAPPKGEIAINAPMPGLIVSIPVEEGQAVKSGQTVVVLESMKMENELKAPRDGVVNRVRVQPRQGVEKGQVLIVIG